MSALRFMSREPLRQPSRRSAPVAKNDLDELCQAHDIAYGDCSIFKRGQAGCCELTKAADADFSAGARKLLPAATGAKKQYIQYILAIFGRHPECGAQRQSTDILELEAGGGGVDE